MILPNAGVMMMTTKKKVQERDNKHARPFTVGCFLEFFALDSWIALKPVSYCRAALAHSTQKASLSLVFCFQPTFFSQDVHA